MQSAVNETEVVSEESVESTITPKPVDITTLKKSDRNALLRRIRKERAFHYPAGAIIVMKDGRKYEADKNGSLRRVVEGEKK